MHVSQVEVDSHSRITAFGLTRPTTHCDGHSYLDRCGHCGHERVRWIGCGKASCDQPGCRRKYSTQRGRRIGRRLGRLGAATWVVVVLTTPAEVREALADPLELVKARKAAVDVVTAWAIAWMFHGVQLRVGGCVTVHPDGDRSPGTWAPHFNVLLPAVGVLDDGAVRVGRWHVPKRALDDLRDRWGVVLERWGFRHECFPQVHVQHAHEPGKKVHAARYFGRHFPAWHRKVQTVTYFGLLAGKIDLPIEPEQLDDDSDDFANVRCRECGSWYTTIAVQGNDGEWIPVGVGPPE